MRRGFLDGYDEGGAGGPLNRRTGREALPLGREGTSDHYQANSHGQTIMQSNTNNEHQHQHQQRMQQRAEHRPDNGFSWFVLKLTVTSALGGFLFGYDTGVVSGAMLLIADDFDLSDVQEEVVVTITIAAAVTAALAGGPGMEHWGRRPIILLAAIIFTVGAVLLAAARSYTGLVMGRLVVGLGIGLASLATPVYISEAAPTHVRGKLVTLNTLFITVGQVVAGVVDGLFADTDDGWRYMLGLSAVPSVFMTVGFLFLPESPRWLVSAGRRREALGVLQQIRGSPDVHREIEEMVESATDYSGTLKESVTVRGLLEDPRIRRALVLGCGLQLLQQLSGINTVMYYSATIFSMAGFSDNAAIWLAAVTAAAQSVGVCLGIFFVEKCGRRSLILSSLGMVVVALVCLGTGFYLFDRDAQSSGAVEDDTNDGATQSSATVCGWLVVAAMMSYLFTFGVGMSSVPWTVNAEIYPTHARSLGTSASTTVNWLGNVAVSATFLSLASDDVLGTDGAFWLYASIATAGWVWLYYCMPETKGRSLEEIELLFAREGDLARPGEGWSGPIGDTLNSDAPRRPGGFALLNSGASTADSDSGGVSLREAEGEDPWIDSTGARATSTLA